MRALLASVVVMSMSAQALAQARNNSPNFDNVGNPSNTNTVNPRTNSNATGGAATANPTSSATSRGGAASANPASTSGAMANPSASSGSSAVTISTGNTSFPSGQSIMSVPTVYVPSIATGSVCAIGASGGASWLGAGFAFGTTWESMQCERRQTAALLFNMGTPESKAAAKEVLCNSPEIRNAYLTIGHPCAADMMVVAGAAGRAVKPPPPPPELPAFDPQRYAKASDCLTAAQAVGAALSLCAGKP
jgi:hypothetical protein